MNREIIREIIPEKIGLQIQTLSNEIFDINDQYAQLETLYHDLQQELKDKDKYITKLEREIVSLNKQVKRHQSDFNTAEKRYFATKQRLEEALNIK